MQPYSGSPLLSICPGTLPLSCPFPCVFQPVLHHTTSKSLSNYPVIHSKPYSPLLFSLMPSIKSHFETTGWTPSPSFSTLWVYTSWWKLCKGAIREAPQIFCFLPCGRIRRLCHLVAPQHARWNIWTHYISTLLIGRLIVQTWLWLRCTVKLNQHLPPVSLRLPDDRKVVAVWN